MHDFVACSRDHEERHLMIKHFECSECGKRFFAKYDLKKHQQKQHPVTESNSTKANMEVDEGQDQNTVGN